MRLMPFAATNPKPLSQSSQADHLRKERKELMRLDDEMWSSDKVSHTSALCQLSIFLLWMLCVLSGGAQLCSTAG